VAPTIFLTRSAYFLSCKQERLFVAIVIVPRGR